MATVDALNTRDTRYLSLDDCISMALKHNLDIQVEAYNPRVSRYSLLGVYGGYEPSLAFSGTKSFGDNPQVNGTVDPKTGLVYNSSVGEVNSYNPSISGVLPTGTKYTLTSDLNRNSTQTLSGGAHFLPPTWSANAGIALSQPLLKNFWIDQTRLQIRLAKNTIKTSEQAFQFKAMSVITLVKKAYFDLLYARGNVDANAAAYKLAQQLVAENRTRVQVGALAPLDEKQSESQAATSLAAMQSAQHQLEIQENVLKSLITDDFSGWASVTLLPSEKLEAIPQTLDLQQSWRLAVAQRPDFQESKIKVESQHIQLKYDFNQRFPQLDLTGSYGRNANQNFLYDALGDIRDGRHTSYSYGLSVNIPLGGNIVARNKYRSDKATLQQLLLQLKQAEQNIIVTVQNDVGDVRSRLQQVFSTRDARIYAEAALDAEQKKLENGKSTSFIVLQLISSLTSARVSEIQALAQYNDAIAQLAFDEGSTLNVNHIKLDLN